MIGREEFNKENVGSNIYFDISCPELHFIEMLRRAYELVGANRILLGSDTPYGKHNIAKAIRKIEKLGVTQEEKAAICGLNILRLINES